MRNRLILIAASLFIWHSAVHAAGNIVVADFEGPDFGNWMVEGEAFGSAPVKYEFRTGGLVHPYRPGMPEMQSAWNADRTELTVTLGEQVDVFRSEKQADGRRRVKHTRNN